MSKLLGLDKFKVDAGGGSNGIKSIQHIIGVIASGQYNSGLIPISPVNPNKTVALISVKSTNTNPSNYFVNGYAADANNAFFQRKGTTGDVYFSADIVEFDDNITIQMGNAGAVSGTTFTVSISAVDISKSYVIHHFTTLESSIANALYIPVLSANSIEFTRAGSGTGQTTETLWVVITKK